jgi:hypothetical protein
MRSVYCIACTNCVKAFTVPLNFYCNEDGKTAAFERASVRISRQSPANFTPYKKSVLKTGVHVRFFGMRGSRGKTAFSQIFRTTIAHFFVVAH